MTSWLKITFAGLLLASAFVSACRTQPAASLENSSAAYGWTLDNNQHARLADYQGKVVLLDFYATWCEPCRAETPHLVRMHQQYGAQGLQIIGLNVGGPEDRDKIPGYAKEMGIQYQLALPDDELIDAYLGDNENIPQAYVFDRSGKIVKRFVGYNEAAGRELEAVIQRSLTAAK